MVWSGSFVGGVIIVATTVLGAGIHGYYSNRWHQSDGSREAAGRILEEFRQGFGNWRPLNDTPFTENERKILRFSGALHRSYVNDTGEQVAVAVIVGPPGQTSTHTAALCYGSRGYESSRPIELVEIEVAGRKHQIARSHLNPTTDGRMALEVGYAWRQGDEWRVPKIPRVAFGGGDYLFKVQVAANAVEGDSDGESPCISFLTEFLEAMEATVFDRLKTETDS